MDFVKTVKEIATIFALILEPTGREEDDYKRIRVAEIPEENKLAQGWYRRTVIVI